MQGLERIHLDPVGGIAGDMFVAALADAFPELVPGLLDELSKLRISPAHVGEGLIAFAPHADASLTGHRFLVESGLPATPPHEHDHPRGHHGHHDHPHVAHRAIQARLRSAGLKPEVLEHALALFAVLAEAEARVHGVDPEEVEFHEVGAWDSIVDFVAAAYLIATLAPRRWTWGPLPLGGGRIATAHGVLPVPAPATTLLLRGFELVDDGIPGERVTPTGAAILRHLSTLADTSEALGAGVTRLAASGHGFGTRKLPGIPNLLRCLAFAPAEAGASGDAQIATLHFEIDDQTAEDLAAGLDRIREAPGVLEVYQVAAYGKKGRLATQVQVLARVDAVESVAALCLAQTTTLGLRIAHVQRRTLARAAVEPASPEGVRVKLAQRPTGEHTAKAEMDDLAQVAGGRAQRQAARAQAEARALESAKPHGPRARKHD